MSRPAAPVLTPGARAQIWTQAALPYGKQWTNMNVMMEVERGFRMPPPANCPRAIYQLMIDCWCGAYVWRLSG